MVELLENIILREKTLSYFMLFFNYFFTLDCLIISNIFKLLLDARVTHCWSGQNFCQLVVQNNQENNNKLIIKRNSGIL